MNTHIARAVSEGYVGLDTPPLIPRSCTLSNADRIFCCFVEKLPQRCNFVLPLVVKLPIYAILFPMTETKKLIAGEFSRTVDERYRLTLPDEFKDVFKPESGKCVIAKERPGCLSLWEETAWKQQHEARVELILQRFTLGDLGRNASDLQRFGRLLSTRDRQIQLAKARFLLPEGFREFLAVEPKQEVMIIGAAVCIEIWHPQKWISYVEENMPQFATLMESLSH